MKGVARAVAELFKIDTDELLIKRSRHLQARRSLLGLCYELLSARKSLSSIGAELGPVGAAALCRNRTVLQNEISRDKKLAQKYIEVRGKLI